jgi:hypothetical protein
MFLVKVQVQYFADCPNWHLAVERLDAVSADLRLDVAIELVAVTDEKDAERVGFHGSPTILIDGTDPFAVGSEATGMACRIYPTPTGPQGVPTLEMIHHALTAAARKRRV